MTEQPTALSEYLRSLDEGRVADVDQLVAALLPAWDDFDGSSDQSMASSRLAPTRRPGMVPAVPHVHDRAARRHCERLHLR